eukprot:6090082-Prymnesium_polylepis.1
MGRRWLQTRYSNHIERGSSPRCSYRLSLSVHAVADRPPRHLTVCLSPFRSAQRRVDHRGRKRALDPQAVLLAGANQRLAQVEENAHEAALAAAPA